MCRSDPFSISFVSEQFRFLMLKFRLADGAGFLGFLEVEQLLTYSGFLDFRFRVRFAAAAETDSQASTKQNQGGASGQNGKD